MLECLHTENIITFLTFMQEKSVSFYLVPSRRTLEAVGKKIGETIPMVNGH